VDEYLNNRQNEILWNLLANPVNNGHLYTYNLERLVNEFPQSGLLHALLTRADSEKDIRHAAAYFSPRALFTMIHASDSLAEVTASQIVQELSHEFHYAENVESDLLAGSEEVTGLNDFDESAAKELHTESVTGRSAVVVAEDERAEVESIDNIVNEEPDPVEEFVAFEEKEPEELIEIPEDETELASAAGTREEEEHIRIADENMLEHATVEDKDAQQEELIMETTPFEPVEDIDDEVYDEIVGIEDISFAQADKVTAEAEQTSTVLSSADEKLLEEISGGPAPEIQNKDRGLNLDDEAEKLILGNIAATDYFVFDKAVGERKQTEISENESTVQENVVVNGLSLSASNGAENQEVSKYFDEAMPYTFMWWLDKTRKEHAGIYQPFKLDTSQAIRQSGAQELQQQYYENIFHLNAVEELDRNTSQQTVEFDLNTKEDRIIKKFIVEEPHINPPSSDKLDTENKARKSAEDQDELVTETLARIYSDQMLFHKAINTYKKLMLKFPEKSRYFADQIEQLERKTN
jgi:hypothetical protein